MPISYSIVYFCQVQQKQNAPTIVVGRIKLLESNLHWIGELS